MLKLSEKTDINEFLKWEESKHRKKSHRFRNFILLLIVALTLWFVLDKKSFLAFWGWILELIVKKSS